MERRSGGWGHPGSWDDKRSVGFGAGLDLDSEVSTLLQVILTFSKATISGALRRAVSKPSQTPPSPSGPTGWTALPPTLTLKSPVPRKRHPKPEAVIVTASSIKPQSSCRPSCCPSYPYWLEPSFLAETWSLWTSYIEGRDGASRSWTWCRVVRRGRAAPSVSMCTVLSGFLAEACGYLECY